MFACVPCCDARLLLRIGAQDARTDGKGGDGVRSRSFEKSHVKASGRIVCCVQSLFTTTVRQTVEGMHVLYIIFHLGIPLLRSSAWNDSRTTMIGRPSATGAALGEGCERGGGGARTVRVARVGGGGGGEGV